MEDFYPEKIKKEYIPAKDANTDIFLCLFFGQQYVRINIREKEQLEKKQRKPPRQDSSRQTSAKKS